MESGNHSKAKLRGEIDKLYATISRKETNAYCWDGPVCYLSVDENLAENKKHTEKIRSTIGLNPSKSLHVLDIGSSTGDLAMALSDNYSEVYCIEPDESLLKVSKLKKEYFDKANVHILQGICEHLPFPDGFFDVIICKTVLEHVLSVSLCISEMSRVLSQGGVLYIEAPNYIWFYEGHYHLPFIPLMPKPLFRLYARLLGRNPSFINHINYVTTKLIRSLVLDEGMSVRDLSLGKIHRILVEDNFTEFPARFNPLKPLLKFSSKLGLNKLLYGLMSFYGMHPNIILVVIK